jgi:alpha/beta superfamily hydrolase
MYLQGHRARLFAIYHEPRRERADGLGAVLCHPLGSEYLRAHRSFVQLGQRLADQGVHAVRFDYAGTGDSLDPPGEPSLDDWVEDVRRVADQVRDGLAVRRLCLLGLRLGASMAALAAAAMAVDSLVLWQPVCNGAEFLDAALVEYQAWLRGSFGRAGPASSAVDLFGFGIQPQLARQLGEIDLARVVPRTSRVLVAHDGSDRHTSALADRLRQRQIAVDVRPSALRVWQKEKKLEERASVDRGSLDAITAWVAA